MKYILMLLTTLYSCLCAANSIELDYFKKIDLPIGQSGCWYYYPANQANKPGNVIAVGDAGSDSINLIINGGRETIGNWAAEYSEEHHLITYENINFKVTISSKVLSESRPSIQLESMLTITSGKIKRSFEVFGECGS